MRGRIPIYVLGALAALSSASAHGCSEPKPATQFTVGVLSQIQVPRDLRSVRIIAQVGGTVPFCETYPVVNGSARLPQSLALAPGPGSNPAVPVTITVVGFDQDPNSANNNVYVCAVPPIAADGKETTGRILRRSRQPYVTQKNLYVPMALRYSCYGKACGEGETCKGGACVSADTDPSRLPSYSRDLLFGDTNTCFDPIACLGDAVGVTVIDEANCIYEVPPGSTAREIGMNVRVLYDGFRDEILDYDAEEGFFLPDPGKPNRFQLAPNVCAAGKSGTRKIVNVNASRTCATKNVYQPLCATAPTPLVPTPSALYILMDQAPSMGEYLGAKSGGPPPQTPIDDVLRVALADPVFSQTKVAFRFVPAPAPNECNPGTYATPGLVPGVGAGFVPVTQASDAIADLIGSTAASTVSVPNAIDAALASAGAFAALSAEQPALLNQRALLYVTNRDVTKDRCGGTLDDPAIEAKNLLDARQIRTYLLSLRNSADADVAARALAAKTFGTASGATVISAEGPDKTASEAEIAKGIASLVADLSSCKYELPEGFPDPSRVEVLTKQLGPAPLVTIPYVPACATGNGDGWAISDGHIRLCGAACNGVRSTMQIASAQTSAKNAVAPTQGQQIFVWARRKDP
jgi:hypothetical protein